MSNSRRLGRVVLLSAAIAALGGVVGTTAPSAAAPDDTTTTAAPTTTTVAGAAAAPPASFEQAANVTRPARRLRQMGSLLFPMEPEPRCYVLNNYGDPRGGRSHEGVDIMATLGQPVYAVADGTLTRQAEVIDSPLSGNAWGLTAALDKTYYFYAHLSAFADGVALGDKVTRGELIGYVGDTGNPGPGNYHLHFEIHPGGQRNKAVDPVPYLEVPSTCTLYEK